MIRDFSYFFSISTNKKDLSLSDCCYNIAQFNDTERRSGH